jgi:hypothetical protein
MQSDARRGRKCYQLRTIGLLAGNPPLESVNSFFGQSCSQVNPGEPLQEDRQPRHFRSIRQEHEDHRQVAIRELGKTASHLLVLPGTDSILADQHDGRPGSLDDLFQGFLPRAARDQLPLVQPHFQSPGTKRFGKLADSGLVLAVVAQEDVEALGHLYRDSSALAGTGVAQGRTRPAECWPPKNSKLVSTLTALEEPSGRLDPRSGDGGGGRGCSADLQRRQLFGQDLAVDAARRGAQEPTAGQEGQGEAGLAHLITQRGTSV